MHIEIKFHKSTWDIYYKSMLSIKYSKIYNKGNTSNDMESDLKKPQSQQPAHSKCYIFTNWAQTIISTFIQDTSRRAKLPPTKPLANRSGLTTTQPFKFCKQAQKTIEEYAQKDYKSK
jgi:hypothetical protein